MRFVRKSLLMLLAGTLLAPACNAFHSTEDCKVDTDCPRGTLCAPEGHYCRTGGPIPVGGILAVTGTQEALGKVRIDGLRFGIWILQRDPATHVLGRGLELVIKDTASTSENVPRLVNELAAKNVAAIIGPMSSPESLDAQKITFPKKLLQLSPGVGAEALGTVQGPPEQRFMFQLSTDIRNGTIRALPLFLSGTHPTAYDVCFDGIATVVNDDQTGDSYEKSLADMLPPNCVPVTRAIRVPRDKKGDYDAEIAALLSAEHGGKPTQCIFLTVYPPVAGELLRLLATSTPSSRPPYNAVFGSSLLNTVAIFDAAKAPVEGKPSLAEGVHGVDFDGKPPRAAFRDLEELWEEYQQSDPALADHEFTADTFQWAEAVLSLALAFEQAGTASDPIKVRDAFLDVMQPGDNDTVVGPKEIAFAIARIRDGHKDHRKVELDYRGAVSDYDFDEHGFIDAPAFVWRANNGAIERVIGFEPTDLVRAWNENPGPACKGKK